MFLLHSLRDWRGLCTLLNYTIPSGCDPNDPIGKIFKFCEAKTTIAHFIQCLERIDRYDVVEETYEFISEYKIIRTLMINFSLI